ncbi:unnamed protein product [Sphagnum balticum]
MSMNSAEVDSVDSHHFGPTATRSFEVAPQHDSMFWCFEVAMNQMDTKSLIEVTEEVGIDSVLTFTTTEDPHMLFSIRCLVNPLLLSSLASGSALSHPPIPQYCFAYARNINEGLLKMVIGVADKDWVRGCDPLFSRHQNSPKCSHVIDEDTYDYEDLVSIDNWQELLDNEDLTGVLVRARGDWLARLATAAVSVKRRHQTIILPDSVCCECVKFETTPSGTTYIC